MKARLDFGTARVDERFSVGGADNEVADGAFAGLEPRADRPVADGRLAGIPAEDSESVTPIGDGRDTAT